MPNSVMKPLFGFSKLASENTSLGVPSAMALNAGAVLPSPTDNCL